MSSPSGIWPQCDRLSVLWLISLVMWGVQTLSSSVSFVPLKEIAWTSLLQVHPQLLFGISQTPAQALPFLESQLYLLLSSPQGQLIHHGVLTKLTAPQIPTVPYASPSCWPAPARVFLMSWRGFVRDILSVCNRDLQDFWFHRGSCWSAQMENLTVIHSLFNMTCWVDGSIVPAYCKVTVFRSAGSSWVTAFANLSRQVGSRLHGTLLQRGAAMFSKT